MLSFGPKFIYAELSLKVGQASQIDSDMVAGPSIDNSDPRFRFPSLASEVDNLIVCSLACGKINKTQTLGASG